MEISLSRDSRVVLVLDDDERVRGSVADCLEVKGYGVVQARHVEEATERVTDVLEITRTLVIVSDFNLEGETSVEFLRRVRRDYGIPALMMSAQDDAPEESPDWRFLRKPVDVPTLRSVVSELFDELQAH